MPLYKVVTRILLYYSLTTKYDTYRTTYFSDSRSHLQYYMHSLHIRITVCLLELTLHYLKLSRLQITNFPLFMPTHHNILIIRLTKRTTLHCSSPANTHPTCRGRSGILDRLLYWTTLLKSNFTIRAHRGSIYRITLPLKRSRQRENGERGGCFEEVSNKCFLPPLF